MSLLGSRENLREKDYLFFFFLNNVIELYCVLGELKVLVEEKLFARTLIFNRPRQLNALSFEMVYLISIFLLCKST